MIAIFYTHQNPSDFFEFLFKKRVEVNNKQIFSSEKTKNSVKFIYDYAHSFFEENFYCNTLY